MTKTEGSSTFGPEIDVVVCTFNRADRLKRCLESLVDQRLAAPENFRILVVDNGSTDDTAKVVANVNANSSVPVIYLREERPGLAFARNLGVRASEAEWVLCFDDDLVAKPNLLMELLMTGRRTGADCVGGRMLVDLGKEERAALGKRLLGILGESDNGDCEMRYSGKYYPPDPNVLRHKRVFEAVGGFDTTMVRGGQDQDFTRRAKRAGFEMVYCPGGVVYHSVPQHRLTPEYFRWASFRHGQSFAYMDFKEVGLIGLLSQGIGRLVQSAGFHLPLLLVASARGDSQEALWRWCMLWRLVGYWRTAGKLVFPRLLQQRGFFSSLEFRKEQRE